MEVWYRGCCRCWVSLRSCEKIEKLKWILKSNICVKSLLWGVTRSRFTVYEWRPHSHRHDSLSWVDDMLLIVWSVGYLLILHKLFSADPQHILWLVGATFCSLKVLVALAWQPRFHLLWERFTLQVKWQHLLRLSTLLLIIFDWFAL